ncbi:hypothetical protein DYB32_000896 [Aphanomyces invadans]|uniref:Uncharacterized protein n=1 Tax=Aphanomyces invadans TaxID=157072 RepID=A0A418B8K7_9STRA|nr:hypothetical protein DYB32_000896 [Aphanomyces invadans]
MSYDMGFIFLGITALIASVCVVPPLAKAIIGPLLSSAVASGAKNYVEAFVKVFYNVLEGTVTIENISVQPSYLSSLRFSLPGPVEFTKVTITRMRLQLPAFFGANGVYSYRMPIQITDFHIEGKIDDSFEKDHEEYLKRAIENKLSQANTATQLVLDYIGRFQPSGPQVAPTWTQKLTRSIVETMELSVNKLTFSFVGNEPATPATSFKLVADDWVMRCTPSEETLKTNRAMVFKNLGIVIGDTRILSFPSLNLDLNMPDVYEVMYSPRPLPQKILGVKLDPQSMLMTLSPDLYTSLMRFYICYLKYCAMLEQLEGKQVEASLSNLSTEDTHRYIEAFKWDPKANAVEPNETITELEKSLTLSAILKLRQNIMKWGVMLRSAGQDSVDFEHLHEKLANDAASFLGKDIAIQVDQWDIKFFDGNLAEPIGDMVMSNVYMTVKTRLVEDLSLELTYGIRNIQLTTDCPSMECQRSQLISHATVQPLLFGHLKQFRNGHMDVDLNLENMSLYAAKDPLEHFLLYLDRLQMGAQAAKTAAQDTGATTSTAIVASQTNAIPSNLRDISSCSILGGALYDINIRVMDLSIFLIPPVVEHTGSLLECTMTVVLDIDSDLTHERISVAISDTALSPRLYQAPEETTGFPTIFSPPSAESLLTPMTIMTDYDLKLLNDDEKRTQAVGQDLTRPQFKQGLAVKIPDISLSFSQLNFAIFWSALTNLSKIETSTAEQRQKRLEIEAAAREAEMELQIKKRLDHAQAQFEEIDVDGTKSIEVDELQLLLQRAIVHDKLLLSELQELSTAIFNHIDKDGSGTIDFDEFKHFLVETMNVEHVRGYLDLFAGEYDCLDTVQTRFGKIMPFEQRDSIVDWHGYFLRIARENSVQFWNVYTSETGAEKTSCNSQVPQLLQKKLVRLLQNFDAAQQCWQVIIQPMLQDEGDLSWSVKRDNLTGGLVEFESAGKLMMSQEVKHEEVTPQQIVSTTALARLIVATNMSLGNLRVEMVDASLPIEARRAKFVIDSVTCQFNMASDIGVMVYDVNAVNSEWAGTMGMDCMLRDAQCILHVPWVFSMGALSKRGSEGFHYWGEAERLFQINLSSSLLQLLKILPEIMSGTLVIEDAPKVQKRKGQLPFQITNLTGVSLKFGADEREIELSPRSVTPIQWPSRDNCTLDIPEWGSKSGISLPRFGPQEIVVKETSTGHAISLIANCRFDDPNDGSVTLKSNVYVTNQSLLDVELKFLIHLTGFTSQNDKVTSIPAHERLALPISVFMGDTELYVRPVNGESWNTSVNLTNDMLLEAPSDEQRTIVKSTSTHSLRKGTIVPIQDQRRSSKLVKVLNPCVHLYRHVMADNMIQWEIAVYAPLVVQNALPYELEYVFMEYRMEKGVKYDMATIEQKLHESTATFKVKSGCYGEVPGVSGQTPGYMAVRLVHNDTKSSWSKAMLMVINSRVEIFTTPAEKCDLEANLSVNVQRISVPDKPRVVKFSAPYWVYNKTALGLEFRLPDDEGSKVPATLNLHPVFNQPIMLAMPKNRLSFRPVSSGDVLPPSWESLHSNDHSPPSLFSQLNAQSPWSDPINVSAVQTNGEIYSGSHVFGVDIAGLMGFFDGSVALSLSPRYIVQNHTPFDVQFRSFATSDSDQIMNDKLLSSLDVFALNSHINGAVYPFKQLNKEPLVKCQKYLSMAMQGSSVWSSVISVNIVGDVYFPLKCTTRKREYIVKAAIQMLGTHVYVVLSDASSSPPYRVENFSMFPVSLRQAEQKQGNVTLGRGQRYDFAWDLAFVNDHKLEVVIQNQKYTVDIDTVGKVKSSNLLGILDGQSKCRLEVVPVGTTRVLRIVDAKLQQLDALRKQVPANAALTTAWHATSIDVRLAGFGVSVLDGYPQEVLYVSMENIQVRTKPQSLEWEVSVFHFQVDNMLAGAHFPVVMNPVNSGFNGDADVPCFKLVIERIESLSEAYGILKLMDISLQPLSVKLELEYLFKLLNLLEPLLLSGSQVVSQEKLALDLNSKPLTAPEPIATKSSDLMYFEKFTIQETEFQLEMQIQKDDLTRPLQSRSWLVNALNQLVGILGSKISGSPTFRFAPITKRHCFTTQSRLQWQLVQNYTREVVVQAYKLVGSMDLLGNPVGVVGDIGSGIISFLKVTGDELTGDSKTRGEGVKILGKTVATSATGFVSKVTGSLDKFMDEVSDVTDTRQVISSDKDHDNILDGSINFAKNFGKGVAGVFTKPIEGAISGGVGGLVQGTVQGLAGPVVVVLKGVTQTTHALAQEASENLEDVVPFHGRRRKELKFENKKLVPRTETSQLDLEIISASGLLAANAGKCNAVCYVYLDDTKVFHTKVLFGSSNPEWHAKFRTELKPNTKRIKFIVKDNFTSFEEEIGKLEMSLDELKQDFTPPQAASPLSQWVTQNVSTPTASNVDKHFGVDPSLISVEVPRMEREYFLQAKMSSQKASKNLQVMVTILDVSDLTPLKNLFGRNANITPFVAVDIGGKVQKTSAKTGTHVAYKETFTFEWKPDTSRCLITVFDKSMLSDDLVGSAFLPLDINTPVMETVLEMQAGAKKDVNGRVTVKYEIVGLPAPDTPNSTMDRRNSGRTAGRLKLYAKLS